MVIKFIVVDICEAQWSIIQKNGSVSFTTSFSENCCEVFIFSYLFYLFKVKFFLFFFELFI